MIVAEFHGHCHKAFELRADTILRLLHQLDGFRRPERFEEFLLACQADHLGRTGYEDKPYPQADYLREALQRCSAITATGLEGSGLSGKALGDAIEKKRLEQVQALKDSQV
jgi:tRNA nucleotidyltransferase (CCA-adding enzyme)